MLGSTKAKPVLAAQNRAANQWKQACVLVQKKKTNVWRKPKETALFHISIVFLNSEKKLLSYHYDGGKCLDKEWTLSRTVYVPFASCHKVFSDPAQNELR